MTNAPKLDSELIRLIEHAKQTKLYQEHYKNLGNTYELQDIPFLKVEDLKKVDSAYFSDSAEAMCVYFTSGTTSEPKAFYHSPIDIAYAQEYIKWIQEVEGIAGGEKMAIFMDQSFWGIGYFTIIGSVYANNAVIPIDNDLPPEVVADLIRISKPTVISSLPSVLIEYKDALKCSSVRVIETTGEPLSETTRGEIEKYYGAEVYDAYGLTEGIVGVECCQHDGYHFDPDKVFIEIVDPDLETPISNGEWGEMILTVRNLSPRPIIRYKSGDICKTSYDTCACGRSYPKIWIQGRKEATLLLHEGSYISKKQLEDVIFSVCGNTEYTINLTHKDDVTILEVGLADSRHSDVLVSKIQNYNYETIFLSKRDKLQISVKPLT